MSADNYMAVKKQRDGLWYVWMVLGGYDERDWIAPKHAEKFENELDAHHYAHKYCREHIVEYGVVLLDTEEE